jgi:hypothetical protein
MVYQLPLRATWAHNLGNIIPYCAVCGLDQNSVIHSLFRCNFARAVWLASPLGLHSLALPPDFIQTVLMLRNNLNPTEFKLFLNTLWCLWKARCSFLYEGKKFCQMEI